jgi:hypothetical protein
MTKTNFKYTRTFSPSLGKFTFLLLSLWIVVNNLTYCSGRNNVLLHPRWPLNPALSEYTVREHFTSCRGWLRRSRQQNRLWGIWWRAHCWRCYGYQATARLGNWGTNVLIFGRFLVRFPTILCLLSVTFFLYFSCCKQMLLVTVLLGFLYFCLFHSLSAIHSSSSWH